MEKVNQMDAALRGEVTAEMAAVAAEERRDAEWIRERVADGRIVIPANKLHIEGMDVMTYQDHVTDKLDEIS